MRYRNREDAGRRLAVLLDPYREGDPYVLALPRGGVPVGFEVAMALGAPLDVIVARKLGAPFQPELGIGAVAEGGVRWVDEEALATLGIAEDEVEAIARRELEELERRARLYRGGRPLPLLPRRTVILVDDGIARGGTVRAAIRAVRRLQPGRIVLAVPVAPPETARALAEEVDVLICPLTPPAFRAVGLWYDDFRQTTDDEVLDLLRRARERGRPGRPSERAEEGPGGLAPGPGG